MDKIKYYFTKEGYEKAHFALAKTVFGEEQKQQDKLRTKFDNAVIIEDTEEYQNWDGQTVIRKCNVEVEINGEIEKWQILGCNECDCCHNVFSCDAPLIVKMLGRKVGETFTYNELQITIKNIAKIQEMHLVHKANM